MPPLKLQLTYEHITGTPPLATLAEAAGKTVLQMFQYHDSLVTVFTDATWTLALGYEGLRLNDEPKDRLVNEYNLAHLPAELLKLELIDRETCMQFRLDLEKRTDEELAKQCAYHQTEAARLQMLRTSLSATKAA